ncbi:MAG: hypothetical protein HQL24_01755 [Candidatus Omnitrophica bacterium]|nr:hypothetical protein [Candidatus Omnitrophota bacterium]
MDSLRTHLPKFLRSDWFIALIILLIFLASNGYHYGWDDQHLELPMLKSLIDHSLYQGDYYVESLKKNFTSFFFPILARLITVKQIPTVYFILFLLSRYFMFFWMFKLWRLLAENGSRAFWYIIAFIVMVRVDEFLYRTMSHEEFTLAFVFAGIYFFYKERFVLAAVILGIAANFHALYSLFPMVFIGSYLLWQNKKHGVKTLVQSVFFYAIFSLPFLIWTISTRFNKPPIIPIPGASDWLTLYKIACPQNFLLTPGAPLTMNLKEAIPYAVLAVIFLTNIFFNPRFIKDKKTQALCFSASILLFFCFLFSYVAPNKFALDLNLIRNIQFLSFFLMGYLLILLMETIENGPLWIGFILAIFLTLLKYGHPIEPIAIILILLTFTFVTISRRENKTPLQHTLLALTAVTFLAGIILIIYLQSTLPLRSFARINLGVILVLLTLIYCYETWARKNTSFGSLRKFFYVIPLVMFSFQFSYYHYTFDQPQNRQSGFWELQDQWEEMQRYVQQNTPKDAMLLVPYNMEMGGFRIFSERKIIACFRDCGIVGFDYNAALEWERRIKDIETFKVFPSEPYTLALQKAIFKYNVDYIVFMHYARPPSDNALLKHIYSNKIFSLYQVSRPHP